MDRISLKHIFFVLFILIVATIAYMELAGGKSYQGNILQSQNARNDGEAISKSPSVISAPISNALLRVTKKPFGIKVSPGNSPVSPERFHGYHTGVDFETFSNEQDSDVPIYTICAGPLALKEYGSGYGGFAVQRCQINGSDVMVIYGHLRLSSISAAVNQNLEQGQQIGVLGKGYSVETDGERKHLHLGIHIGKNIDTRGYVQSQGELKGWLDVATLLK